MGGVVGGVVGRDDGPPGPLIEHDGALEFNRARMGVPVKIAGRAPAYPDEAKAQGLEGTLLARCVITTTGALEDCKLLKSTPAFEREVREVLATYRYRPILVDGKPVRVWYRFPFRFVAP